jgi:hypothetical protein
MSPTRVLLAVLVSAPLLKADVLVVDSRGGGDFTSVSAAVLAAQSGDTILVHDGDYVESGPVVIDGKPLSIVAEWTPALQAPGVTIRPGLLVRNLSPAEFVVLENLDLRGAVGTSTSAPTAGLVLHDNSSHVRVQGCTITGGSGDSNAFPDGAPGVDVANSYSTALTGCQLLGGSGQFSPTISIVTGDGGPGLALVGGQVHLSHCIAFGGSGGSDSIGGFGQGGTGGAGVAHASGTLLLVSTAAQGGEGGTSFHGGDGGDGLHLGAAGFAWLMAGSGANGGHGGSSDEGPDGADGSPIDDPSGLVVNYGGSPHGFDLTSPLREGHVGTLFLGGDPSDSTLLFASLSLHQLAFPAKQGVLMLAPDSLIGPFAIGSGSAQLPITAPLLPASLPALNVHVQPVYIGADGVVLGAGRVLTLLDASF